MSDRSLGVQEQPIGLVSRGALRPGVRIRNYEIISVLGQGGFGTTYKALDLNLHREVAIKEYLPIAIAFREGPETVMPRSTEVAQDFLNGRTRFLNEARTLARLDDYPSIVRVLDFLEANGTAYMVMSLVRGDTLALRIATQGRLGPDETQALLASMMRGLEEVHAAGFLHRDIKPANILIGPRGAPVLIDFGAARAALATSSVAMTAIFTPGYAAAEQFTSAKQGPWTDIYGLAATIYHAITGGSPPNAFDRIVEDLYSPLVRLQPPSYPISLLAGIDAGLAVRANDRPSSIAAWRETFREPGGGSAVTVMMPQGRPSQTASARQAGSASEKPTSKSTGSSKKVIAGVVGAIFVGAVAISLAPQLSDTRFVSSIFSGSTTQNPDARGAAVSSAALPLGANEAAEQATAKAEQEAAARQVEEQAAAKVRAELEAAARQVEEQAAATRQAEEQAAAKAKAEQEAAAKQAEEQAAAKAKAAQEAAVRQAEEQAAAKAKAEQEAKQLAAANERAALEAAKQKAEADEVALRLTIADRQRLQAALTSLGFDTQGTDGVFGPRTRQLIASWQGARGYPATGYLAVTQQAALLREAGPALTKRDEEEKRKADELRRKADEDAKAKAVPPPGAAAPSNVSPPGPAGGGSRDGHWFGSLDCKVAGRISVQGMVSNGKGSLSGGGATVSLTIAGDNATISASGGNISGQAQGKINGRSIFTQGLVATNTNSPQSCSISLIGP